MRKIIILLFTAVMCLCLCGLNVKAEDKEEENQEVQYNSTVQVNYGYLFEDGSMDVFCSAPAVVINSNTLITYDMTEKDYSSLIQDRAEGYNTLGIKTEDIQANFSFAVYTGEGSYIPVTEKIGYETDGGKVLVLKTEQTLSNPITFSPGTQKNDETLYATGFSVQDMDGSHFISKDSVLKNNIKIISQEENVIKFSVDSNESFSGSAIVNGYNQMYGLILNTDNGGIAITSAVVEYILDDCSLIYTVGETISPIDKTELHSVTDAAANIDTKETQYTQETLDDLNEKIDRAVEVINNPDASQEEIDAAAQDLKVSMDSLEEVPKKEGLGWIAWGIIISVILIFICAIAILLLKNPDMLYKLLGVKKKETPGQAKGTVTSNYIGNDTVIDGLEDINAVAAQTAAKRAGNDFSNQKNFQGGYIYEDRRYAPVNNPGVAIPETSVLKSDIASNDEIVDAPYIIRVSTGERILINRNQFTIGRDYNVDYRIPENISISKCHCTFMSVGDHWYIIDNKSSNKTLVNGVEIRPNESVPIFDKSEIVLANEKLIFRFIKGGQPETAPQNQNIPDTGALQDNIQYDVQYPWQKNLPQYKNNYINNNTQANTATADTVPATEMYDNTMQAQNPAAAYNNAQYQETYNNSNENAFDDADEDPDTNVLTANQIPDSMRVPYLIIQNKKIKITKTPFSLGRSKKATYKFTNDSQVSREHVIITKEDGKYYIKDNNSSNGTFLNGEPLDPLDEYLLNNGDKINILYETIEFHL